MSRTEISDKAYAKRKRRNKLARISRRRNRRS
jgi:hypothetical protein